MRRHPWSVILLCLCAFCLLACGKPATVATTTTPTPAAARHIAISLRDGGATPDAEDIEVKPGTEIDLDITSDRTDEVHVHGYDIQVPVQAGQTVTRTFVADKTGRFEIETHHPAKTLVLLDVR